MELFLAKYSVYAVFLVMVLEFVLGKTKLVKANSTIEAALNVVKDVLKFLFNDRDDEKK